MVPTSSSKATATRMNRAAVASASRRTLAEADLAVLEDQAVLPAASSNSTRAADRPEAIKVVVVAAATRSARSTPKSRSARAATSLRLGTRQRRLGKANQPTIFIKGLAAVSELGQHLGQLFVDFANEPR